MMSDKILFKNLKICDPNSSYNNKRVDVFVQNGIIKQIGKELNKRADDITIKGGVLYPGFCDLYADFCDPGFEHREGIDSGIQAALRGGYTSVCVTPNTNPAIQSKSTVEYIVNSAKGKGVDVLPLGCISADLKGESPTEMYDMYQAGAIGFTDAPHTIKTSGQLLRALQYVQPFDGLILDLTTDESLSNHGQINEGEISVRKGMKGIPHIAEVVQIKRNIEILRYTGGKLHLYGVTTKEGVALIKIAKKEGLRISASVFVHHLLFTDETVMTYDSNYKVMPPFRLKRDKDALLKGLLDGTIDCVATQHIPVEIEGKKLEFEYATPGLIGLETAYSILKIAFEGRSIEGHVAKWLSINPRKILGLNPIVVDVKQKANFTIVDSKASWVYHKSKSKSNNSPLMGAELKGQVKAVYHQGKLTLND